jgi:hypothetical protein
MAFCRQHLCDDILHMRITIPRGSRLS